MSAEMVITGKEWTNVWFTGPDHHVWHGIHIGDFNQLVHCKRTRVGVRP